MARVAFIGLGVMGGPMAGHLAAAGHEMAVYNRSRSKAEAWETRHGGCVADSPAEAADGAAAVIACVGRDEDVEEVALGADGALAAMAPGTLWIDHTTASARLARRIAEEADNRRLLALDAPVSGGEAGAVNGTLAAMCGGSEEAFAAAQPYLQSYCARSVLIGGPGSGQLAKMANQICIAGVVESLAEAIQFGRRAGLDMDRLFEALSGGAASSWQMLNRWQTMCEGKFDFGFAVDWMRKDLALTLEEARANGSQLPLAEMVDRFYADVQEMGGNRLDTSSLLKRYIR
jgi:3-hydroxyisobutyrate dehydrogenase